MKTYSFAYGSGTVELPLDEKNVIGELHGNAVAPLADIRAALWASLDAPIDSAPLCERAKAGDTVTLQGDLTLSKGLSLLLAANQTITLDLNGHTLRAGAELLHALLALSGEGTLRLTGGALRGSGEELPLVFVADGTLEVANVTIDNAGGTAARLLSGSLHAPATGEGAQAILSGKTAVLAQYDAIAPEAASSTVGRLIAGEEWRFVTVLSAADAARLQKGQALSLRAATGVDFDLDVTVERIGREENGRVIVVLRGGSHLAYVTLLRAQNVELILARYEGLRIPKNALRVDADGSSGVYCLVGLRAYRKPVEVLWQGEDYCLVRPVGIETTSESLRQLYTLRAGDEAIVSANDLYDGKVVE